MTSRLQFKLATLVISAFALALIVSTAVVVTAIGELGKLSISRQLDEETAILERRFEEWNAELLKDARVIARLLQAHSITSTLEDAEVVRLLSGAVSDSVGNLVWLVDTDGVPMGSFSSSGTDVSVLSNLFLPDSFGEGGTQLLIVEGRYLLTAVVPLFNSSQHLTGYVINASFIDGERLGQLNFYRDNVAFTMFTDSPQFNGMGANEANGLAHLPADEVERLRLDEEARSELQATGEIRLFEVSLRGTPHAIVYRLLPLDPTTPVYYSAAIDEDEPRAVQNTVLLISLGTIFIVIVLTGGLISASLLQLVLHPLHILSENARRFGTGQFDSRIRLTRSDEIGLLYSTFNTMAESIQHRTRELDTLNAALEAKVRERTLEVEQQAVWLETIFCQAQEAIVVLNTSGDVSIINDAALKLLQVDSRETSATSFTALFEARVAQPFTLPEIGTKLQGEFALQDHHYQYSVVAIELNPAGDLGGYVCVIVDVTSLRRLNGLQSQIIRLAAHDLRVPLTTFGLQFHLLQRYPDPLTERQKGILGRMQDTTIQMKDMINTLLNVKRIEEQVGGLNETVRIDSLVASAMALLDFQFSEKRQIVSVEMMDNLPTVLGDPVRLLEVLRNLLSNAHKYTPSEGTIYVRAFRQDRHLRVEVEDSGIGIHPEDLPRLFEAGFRAKTALSSDIEGQGIGLHLVKTIIEEHSGQLWVTSEPNRGSTFTFVIPITAESPVDIPSSLETRPES